MHEILPFNVPSGLRAAMYRRKQPEVLWAPIILYYLPSSFISHLESQAAVLKAYFERKSDLTDVTGHLVVPMVRMVEMPQFLIPLLHQKLRDWMLGDVYLQSGYYDEAGVCGIASRIACAMTFHDHCSCAQSIADPAAHVAVPVAAEDAIAFERSVQSYYRSGIGVWPRALTDHRTKVLVMARALLMRRDPVHEFDRFTKSGGTHFLDYPILCT